jgi:heme-degrading monooxygenase HmoA
MSANGYAALWEFTVRPDRREEFERHYGPGGSWARLFGMARGYEGTELLNDRSNPDRYVTIDRWTGFEAWQAFRDQYAAQYEALDRECEGLTIREARLGEFGR